MKATAPTIVSPVNGQQPDSLVLTARTAEGKFDKSMPLTYQFQIAKASGAVISECTRTIAPDPGATTVSYLPTCVLEFEQPHTWKVRARSTIGGQDYVGPWSADGSFRAPAGGYIRNNEVYDPLTNGKTVGEIFGPVTFIPGVGVRLETFNSYIRYRLPQTLVQGEFSLIITGLEANTEGDKTKVFAMSEGLDDLITNNRRMTVEKRGDPSGIIAWRLISHLDQIDTEGAEREFVAFDPNVAYLWTATWNGFFNVRIQAGGSNGPTLYSKGKPYKGAYDPDPHYAFIGAPEGRSGATAATVPGMIVRNVWISPQPRPATLPQ